MAKFSSLTNSASSTFSWCLYLNVKDWSPYSSSAPVPSQPRSRVRGHSCTRRDAGFCQCDPGPLQMEDGASSCLTQLRSTQRAVKAHHRHTLLQSIPYSLLTECVSATHSSLTLLVLTRKSHRERKQSVKKKGVFLVRMCTFVFLSFINTFSIVDWT